MKALKIFLCLALIPNFSFSQSQEPSEVKEIREIYQKVKSEIKTTENKFSADYQNIIPCDECKTDDDINFNKAMGTFKTNLNAYFSDRNQEKLKFISLDKRRPHYFNAPVHYDEYLFKDDLIFAYTSIWEEGNHYELRCYFQNQELISSTNKGDNVFFDTKNTEKQCKELQETAKNLKKSLSSLILIQNAN